MTIIAALDSMPGIANLSGLRSSNPVQRLEQVASLRARGIGDNIDLPQLVVCGDQSAGKSSVLEGLTGIPFPRDDGVCTKFPTEVRYHTSKCRHWLDTENTLVKRRSGR